MDKSELQSLLAQLVSMRQRAENLYADVDHYQTIMLSTPEGLRYRSASMDLLQTTENVKNLESRIREMVVEIYTANPEGGKKPVPGVGIRVSKRAIYDREKARQYCLDNLPGLMELNTAKFEKMATAELYPFDFVSIEEFITATISGDLSEYLAADASPTAQPVQPDAAVEDAAA